MPTHLNVYKEEATVALAKVKDAVGEAEAKLEALLAQVEALTAPVAPPTEEPTAPVEEPAAPVEASTPVSAPTATKPSK